MKIVVSMINVRPLTGPFTIFAQACGAIAEMPDIQADVLCHSLRDVKDLHAPNIRFLEYPLSRKNWLFRLFYEFVYFFFLARKLKPAFWLSLHDISPFLGGYCPQAVYCHNSSPFYKPRLLDFQCSKGFFLFTLFYRHLYRINIHSNRTVIVQQDWMRREFQKLYRLQNILVARPEKKETRSIARTADIRTSPGFKRFFFPAVPRPFKNFEVICEAVKILNREINPDIEVVLTLSPEINSYARFIYEKYSSVRHIRFAGRMTTAEVHDCYARTDALIFPSKLETWGLPISEFEPMGRGIFAADLPYAHETVGTYDKVCFFNPDSPEELARKMELFLSGKEVFVRASYETPDPVVRSFREMFQYILKK